MCMLLLRVVLLAVAIDTCTYLLCGVYVYTRLICLILGVEALRGMPSTLLGRTAQRNSECLNRCKGYADVFFLIVFLNSESKKAPQHHVLRFGARTQGSPAKGEAAQKRGAPLFRIAPLRP